MNRNETLKILAILSSVYPSFMKERDPAVLAEVWGALFAEDDAREVRKAVLAFIGTDTKGYPPAPGAVKEQLSRMKGSGYPSETEAWALVRRAASRGIYNSEEGFRSLPPYIREIVGSPHTLREWAMLPENEVDTVVASNFMRSYRARIEARRKADMLPSGLAALVPGGAAALPQNEKNRPLPEPESFEAAEMPESFRQAAQALFDPLRRETAG